MIDKARNFFLKEDPRLEMDYDLANLSGEKIDKLITPEGKETEFSLQSYFNLYKLTRVCLYLGKKEKNYYRRKRK